MNMYTGGLSGGDACIHLGFIAPIVQFHSNARGRHHRRLHGPRPLL